MNRQFASRTSDCVLHLALLCLNSSHGRRCGLASLYSAPHFQRFSASVDNAPPPPFSTKFVDPHYAVYFITPLARQPHISVPLTVRERSSPNLCASHRTMYAPARKCCGAANKPLISYSPTRLSRVQATGRCFDVSELPLILACPVSATAVT